jgi:hypothetical protein
MNGHAALEHTFLEHNDHIGQTSDEVQDKLHAAHPFPRDVPHQMIKNYTNDSENLNRHLYNTHLMGREHLPSMGGIIIKHLDAAIHSHKIPDHISHLSVFSGTKFHPGDEAKKTGGKLFLPAYTSTTIHPSTGFSFAREYERGTMRTFEGDGEHGPDSHVLHIHVPKGHPGVFVGKHSNHDKEKEFLLPRRTQLEVDPKPTIIEHQHMELDGPPKIGRIHVWHARALGVKE